MSDERNRRPIDRATPIARSAQQARAGRQARATRRAHTAPLARATPHDLDQLVDLAALAELEAEAHVDAGPRTATAELTALERRVVDAPPRAALVRVWWAGLGADARRILGARAPLATGNLDGVPWPARVEANHRTLRALLDRLDAQGSPDVAPHTARISRTARTPRDVRAALRSERLHALAAGPGVVDRGGKPRFLLACDPDRGAIVEYVGASIADTDDPFASPFPPGVSSVAVFVPGNESDLVQFEGKAHTMSELVHAAEPGTTGLVVWQGGRFPHGPQAIASRFAARLAPRLGAFVNAIPRDPGVRLVAFGFSFGGAVVGTAMRLGMRVDAVVHVASAGLGAGVRSLDDYPASARVPHASLLAPGDLQVAPYLGLDLPRGLRGIGHGVDPSGARGVTRLETGFLQAVPEGGELEAGRRSGVLRGHARILEQWGTTAKHGMLAALAGGRAELAARRRPVERVAERLGLPWSPVQRRDYTPRFVTLPGPATLPGLASGSGTSATA